MIEGSSPQDGNIIARNGAAGVYIDGSYGAARNTIASNSIYSNTSKGIELRFGANSGIQAPVVTETGSASGTACANCTVQVFSDLGSEGRIYEGTAVADASGHWFFPGALTGPHITSTGTVDLRIHPGASGSSKESYLSLTLVATLAAAIGGEIVARLRGRFATASTSDRQPTSAARRTRVPRL